mmetsp:Transcript_2683/g.3004  ORF Transcript_2683/g.3004 Transcript_2683/m.3004 type:complete len:279 (-) Transcript_2683:157-993(-)
MLYCQRSNDYILQCHDISQLLPAFESDNLPESYTMFNYQSTSTCGASSNIKREAPIQSQVFYNNLPFVQERQPQRQPQRQELYIPQQPINRIAIKQEPCVQETKPVYTNNHSVYQKTKPVQNTNQNKALVLRAQPLLQRVMGKSKTPYLYAVCLAAILKLGVHMENDKFLVFNDSVFMTAINVFSQYKQKRPRDTYGAYKSIKRWAQVIEKRRKGNSWRFGARPEKRAVWHQAFVEIESILKIQSHVKWTCPRTGRDLCIDITSKEFQTMICEVSRQH